MTTNLTVRVDESTKKEFDIFCENVGINATSAVNMFIKNVIRTRALPFIVTDSNTAEQTIVKMKSAIKSMREQSELNGNANMSMDEINNEISNYRKEKRGSNA